MDDNSLNLRNVRTAVNICAGIPGSSLCLFAEGAEGILDAVSVEHDQALHEAYNVEIIPRSMTRRTERYKNFVTIYRLYGIQIYGISDVRFFAMDDTTICEVQFLFKNGSELVITTEERNVGQDLDETVSADELDEFLSCFAIR